MLTNAPLMHVEPELQTALRFSIHHLTLKISNLIWFAICVKGHVVSWIEENEWLSKHSLLHLCAWV